MSRSIDIARQSRVFPAYEDAPQMAELEVSLRDRFDMAIAILRRAEAHFCCPGCGQLYANRRGHKVECEIAQLFFVSKLPVQFEKGVVVTDES